MPEGEVHWEILNRKHDSTRVERTSGKEKLKALKPAEIAELSIGAAEVTGYRDVTETSMAGQRPSGGKGSLEGLQHREFRRRRQACLQGHAAGTLSDCLKIPVASHSERSAARAKVVRNAVEESRRFQGRRSLSSDGIFDSATPA